MTESNGTVRILPANSEISLKERSVGNSKLAVAMAYAALFHAEAERMLDGKLNNAEQTRLQLMAALEALGGDSDA